jgi:hypothetical protein
MAVTASSAARGPAAAVWTLIGLGCIQTLAGVLAAGGLQRAILPGTALRLVSCAGSLVLLALLRQNVAERHPGIASLYRLYSHVTLAGCLLHLAAGVGFVLGAGATPALAADLAAFPLTLLGALPLLWLLADIAVKGPVSREIVIVERLSTLSAVVHRCRMDA